LWNSIHWKKVNQIVDCLQTRIVKAVKLAIGDGALGFWKALRKTFPKTRHQRCWVHKTANVLNKLPKIINSARVPRRNGVV